MHLVETFSLSSGIKIGKPWVLEKFFPLGLSGDYIVLQPFGKFESRKYDYWNDALNILAPILDSHNISILQIGGKEEPRLDNVIYLAGQTSYNQVAYLIRNSVLFLGVDSFGVHIASGLSKKIVGLYCNMYTQHSRPYWSKEEDVVLLEADRKGNRPSYSMEEDPKTINTIYPEVIAKSVCDLLNIDFNYPYKTVFIGENFSNKTWEMIPAHPTYLKESRLDSVIVRMDLLFNEQVLTHQLSISDCSILTNKPINIDIIKKFKGRIKEFVYLIDENSNPDYVRALRTNGVKCNLFSFLEDEELNKYKLDYIEYGKIIQRKRYKKEDFEELKDKNLNELFYKSGKHYMIGELSFWRKDPDFSSKPIKDENKYIPQKISDSSDFWDGADSYHILEKA